MTSRTRLAVATLVLTAVLAAVVMLAFAAGACPSELPGQPCPDEGFNRGAVLALAGIAVGLGVTPFAFLAEYAVRRRIAFRGAWARAARRGILAAAVLASIGGLRLGGALSAPAALFVISLAIVVEWFSIRRLDAR